MDKNEYDIHYIQIIRFKKFVTCSTSENRQAKQYVALAPFVHRTEANFIKDSRWEKSCPHESRN